MDKKTFGITLGSAPIEVSFTPLAPQANGSVMVRAGDTTVLATAVMSKKPREGGDFFPLTVDYEEKFYAAGKILGSRFVKRESRPSEEAVLTARLIDRTIRPRFDLSMRNEVQVIVTVLSIDDAHDPDIPAILAASLALATSDIPWDGPVAGVRVARKNGEWLVNPTFEEREGAELDAVLSGQAEKINMIEANANEVPETVMAEAFARGQEEIMKLASFVEGIISAMQPEKTEVPLFEANGPVRQALRKNFSSRIEDGLWTQEKTSRNAKLAEVKSEWEAFAKTNFPETRVGEVEYVWGEEIDAIVHRRIIDHGERPDGRKADELRALSSEVAILPRVHGSGLFIRGETQALSTVTLGGPGDEQIVEGMKVRTKRRFLHHYNFPPYSTGEVKPLRGPGRREIGHGALAERALLPLLPSHDLFPYTIRVVSEILSSNGSSSMASVCGSTLAMFDAGIPMKKPAAGIAMGLMMKDAKTYRVLTDIQGPEDHYGDMDFKAAGTRDGITALQMDVKIDGVTVAMLTETLEQARKARMEILDVMTKTLPTPREHLSPYAPRIVILKINPEKIGALIGPGGKVINGIIAATGVAIDIEDDGSVFITSEKEEAMERALQLVKQITHEYTAGELLDGTVTRLFDFGAMVEVGPKQEGLVHISELAPWHVGRVEDIVNIGDKIPVMVKNVDDQGRLNLSLKSVPGRYSQEDITRGEAEARSRPPQSRNARGQSFDRGHNFGERRGPPRHRRHG